MVRVAGAVMTAALVLGGCQQGSSSAGGDKNAGLDAAIRTWHASVKDGDALCANKPEDQSCNSFQVTCKGERPLGPDDAAQGVTAKVVAAMSWQAWHPQAAEYRPASGVVEFTKVGGEWRRAQTGPVNLTTCA